MKNQGLAEPARPEMMVPADQSEMTVASIVSVAFLLIAVALTGSYVPALRATRVDPADALRSE